MGSIRIRNHINMNPFTISRFRSLILMFTMGFHPNFMVVLNVDCGNGIFEYLGFILRIEKINFVGLI